MPVCRSSITTMERWIGKIAVVTGASSGIGEAIAKVLVRTGVNVVGFARREERLQVISKELDGSKGSLHPVRGDVRNEADILRAFQYAKDKFGGVDILVNNAGICQHQAITEASTESLRALLEVNVLGAAVCAREAVKSIRQRGTEGHIININSILGLDATIATVPVSLYPASKFALHAMTINLREEIRQNRDNIRMTGIYPGLVKTEILEMSGADPRVYNKLPYVESEDIADAVIYALSAPCNVQVEEIKITPLHDKY
ncbi:dehydrogenase/reductase SDR family member 11-like isoform X2 [Fopius arisanus]|uniref:Dehydrogenase/reductase SDR family member 11-like isoform X2 n=1 Tax=Fopius arisanus TaxID=64838 RepID=A0A9R1SWP4_9HYME|nr:PREDICTED: dehydrogenase/reductase SDR family member 11-like isoform X2 [Fopius arisanus]